jgi:alkanesulfonate monooxygenase SsuD/methylene tetrahydromethanopterin reductase-like flavin-dependent oxidoreductase (luciferase family)
MRIGLLTLGDLMTDPVTGQRRTPAQKHRTLVEQAALAEQCGFESVHLGEHHLNDYILSSPHVVLAAIAERTTSMRLSNGVALAANRDPLLVAEEYATLDALSAGRVEPCFGRGTLFPDVYTSLGQDEDDAVARFAENVELIHRIWTSDGPLSWDGRFRAPLRDATVHPRPTQLPRPPIWIGAGLSPDSIDLAARLGCRLMLPTVFGTWDMFRPIVDLYKQRWAFYGHAEADRRIGACSHFFVAHESQNARTRWAPRYMGYMQAVIDWSVQARQRAGSPNGRSFPLSDFDTMISTIGICGSPAEVLDRMADARDTLDIDTHILKLDMGGLPDDELFEAIELAGAEVIPHAKAL